MNYPFPALTIGGLVLPGKHVYKEVLVLEGLELGYRTTELRFKPVEKLPDFEEFVQKISGSWELYKVEKAREETTVSNMEFVISEQHYTISRNDSLIETGKVLIDTRHKKINFENEKTSWNARFVWDELRLENKEMNLIYRLRKN